MSFTRATALLFATRFLTFFVQAGTGVLLARLLGPEDRGTYALLLLIPTVMSQTLTFGLNVSNAYYLSHNRLSAAQLYIHSLGWSLGVGVPVALLLAAGAGVIEARWLSGAGSDAIASMAWCIPALLLFHILLGMAQGQRHFGVFAGIQMLRPVIFAALFLLLYAVQDSGLASAINAFVISYLVAALALILVTRPDQLQLGLQWPALRQQLHFSWKAYAASTLGFLFFRVDIFFIGIFLDNSAAGYYAVMVLIAESLWMMASSAGEVLLPVLPGRRSESSNLVAMVTRHVLLLTAAAVALMLLLDRWLISFAFGTEFLPAVDALRWAYPGILARAGIKVLANYIVSEGKPGLNATIGGAGLALNIGLDVALIPSLGLNGAAMAASCSYVFMFIATATWVCHARQLRWRHLLVPAKRDLRLYLALPQKLRNAMAREIT